MKICTYIHHMKEMCICVCLYVRVCVREREHVCVRDSERIFQHN